MPADLDHRVQKELEEIRLAASEIKNAEAAKIHKQYLNVARAKHDEIAEMMNGGMSPSDALFEANIRSKAEGATAQHPGIGELLEQFPGMREEIVASKDQIIAHTERGKSLQDALYETQLERVGLSNDSKFRGEVEEMMKTGKYPTRQHAGSALDAARTREMLASLGSGQNTIARHASGPTGKSQRPPKSRDHRHSPLAVRNRSSDEKKRGGPAQ